MVLSKEIAEQELEKAGKSNPGMWTNHSKYTAMACQNIAKECKGMDADKAYILGLLHDIGRYVGVTSERHTLDGYHYCMRYGWEEAAQVCISHAFMIQNIETGIAVFDVSEEEYEFLKNYIANAKYSDYDLLVQLCDSLAMPNGFCILEKRFVDVAIRYGIHASTIPRWKKTMEIRTYFEEKIGCSIYDLLPGINDHL